MAVENKTGPPGKKAVDCLFTNCGLPTSPGGRALKGTVSTQFVPMGPRAKTGFINS
jgi:hypothetical protein